MDSGVQMTRLVSYAPIFCLFSPKTVFLAFLALLTELNYSTWVQNQSHGANIRFLHSSWEKHGTFMTAALIFYYGNLGLGVYPWEGGHRSEHIHDKDFVCEYLIMFSNRCFHLRYSVLESPQCWLHWKNVFCLRRATAWTVMFLRIRRTIPLLPPLNIEIDAGRGAVSPGFLLLKFTLSKKYLLSIFYVPDTFLDAREIAIN